jgi:hypothetical protein
MAALTDSPGRGSNCLGILVVVLGFCAEVRAVDFAGGTGTREDPYQIATAEQLIALGADLNLLAQHCVGGLLGQSGGRVQCCYACGPVTGIWDVRTTGGLVGNTWKAGLIEACYFLPGLGDLSWNNGVGTPLTDEQMRDRANFAGWDFTGQLTDGLAEAWMMPAEGGCPVLSQLSGYVPPLMIEDAFVAGSVGSASGRPSGRTKCGTATLAGENTGTIEDCSCRGTVLGTSEVGGLVGHDRGSLVRCASCATAVGCRQVGGLVGISEGRLFACHAEAHVLAGGDLGGLADTTPAPSASARQRDRWRHRTPTAVPPGVWWAIIGGLRPTASRQRRWRPTHPMPVVWSEAIRVA